MKRSFWWYRPSILTCALLGAMLVFAFRAFAQDVSTPPAAPLPGIPAQVQYVWVYYVVPVFVGLYMTMLGLSHVAKPGTKFGNFLTWFFSGAKALARATGVKLPEEDSSVSLPLKPDATKPAPKPPGGYARLELVSTMAILALALLPACGTFSAAQGSTGKIDLGKDVACTVTLGALDTTTCSKPITTNCEVPEPKDSTGACSFLQLDTGTLNLGKGYSCRATASESGKPCIALIATTCMTPVPRQADGTCR